MHPCQDQWPPSPERVAINLHLELAAAHRPSGPQCSHYAPDLSPYAGLIDLIRFEFPDLPLEFSDAPYHCEHCVTDTRELTVWHPLFGTRMIKQHRCPIPWQSEASM